MNVELLRAPTEEDWLLVKQCTMATIGKKVKTPPGPEWKAAILRARHSPIRELKWVFLIEDLPYWVAMHLVRHHIGAQPYVSTQRNDRQRKYDRGKAPQDAPVTMAWSLNAEALMNIANKRLCNQASPETQVVVRRICDLALETCLELDGLLVPMCERCGGICHEMYPCGI